ncbi:hypothetical protein LTS08_005394 [Lithohypha guttulata]|uniref:Zn(2)-C6 fungal-type domain-containing protein n=1 Tax=Lithohypha guttulata TaxID=1690604 RepID=A0AAN7T6Y4_9EURO|nr:hypothetical protein LTR05_001818 [Lithohypha guttulata]KAK5100643.1 hypothetical protein LTS08_005394 [Lithohypha guttulata]
MADDKNAPPVKRVSRACTFCRARKSRCDLEASGGQPPCGRCRKENRECILASSNRGGSRVRKKTLLTTTTTPIHSLASVSVDAQHALPTSTSHLQSPETPIDSSVLEPISSLTPNPPDNHDSDGDSPIDSTIPRNPSDAWQLLRDVAKDGPIATQTASNAAANGVLHTNQGETAATRAARGSAGVTHTGLATYRLVREGYLTAEIVHTLVQQYYQNYHCYLPLVPRSYFGKDALDQFAVSDKHLLTAVLTIASNDLVDQPHIHQSISRYMHDLVSGVAAGHDCDVEAVEALLLLAEWEPPGLRNNIEVVGRGEEDRSAWMHVGMALRTGYFLSLDRTAFRQESDEEAKIDARKRFAWANCYVSDRLISVRIGRAFWSRGPGPMTGLSTRDFPTLQPQFDGDEDYAKVFQAQLDLTQLFSNVHDVLYSGMRSSNQMMLLGDYVKYVDDFRTAIDRWQMTWGNIQCSQHIKITLDMSYQYLRLYTNAFVFQAQISQAISKKKKDKPLREHLRQVFSNVGAMPDARFIWGSVAAAKQFLNMLATQVDPTRHLRYMPLRFYLYTIYSAVFLYKARSFGVLNDQEQRAVCTLIYSCIDVLRQASLSPHHAGSRYARLLELLWMRPLKLGQPYHPMRSPAARSDSQLSSTGSIRMDAGGYMQYSPADFSWLDLEAVGDFVSGDPMPNQVAFMGMNSYQNPAHFMPSPDTMNWQAQNSVAHFQLDLNGNLLF